MTKFPIKDSKSADWEKWCQQLIAREEEVIQTLENENVFIETCFRDDEYVYIVMVMKDYNRAAEAVSKKPFPIDLEHRKQRRDALHPPVEMKRLFHFVNDKAL